MPVEDPAIFAGKLIAFDWKQLPVPTQYTDIFPNDDRVLPLA
jgi:hypothetical protein